MDVQDESNSTKRCRRHEPQNELVRNIFNWNQLPYPATVGVLSYLSDKDRVAMAQVCRVWNNSAKSPSLWRTRKLILKGHSVKTDIHFTTIYGACLKNVDLQIWYGLQRNLKSITKSVETVTEHLKNARLNQLKLLFISFKQFKKFPELLNTIYTCIIKLFEIQNELKKVTLASCRFSQSIGTELLKTLATSSGENLVYLDITNFIHMILNGNDLDTLRETLPKFSNLTNLSVNYSFICDEVLRRWAVSLRHKLEAMKIIVSSREPHHHIIKRETWREISSSCPNLKVTIMINDLSQANKIISILQPSIPLTKFILMARFVNGEFFQLADTLKHLAGCFHHRLEYLMIECQEIHGFVDKGLVDILEQCRRLQTFRFVGNFGPTVPNKICDLLNDSQSVLCSCVVENDLLGDVDLDPGVVEKMNVLGSILPLLVDDAEDSSDEDILDNFPFDIIN